MSTFEVEPANQPILSVTEQAALTLSPEELALLAPRLAMLQLVEGDDTFRTPEEQIEFAEDMGEVPSAEASALVLAMLTGMQAVKYRPDTINRLIPAFVRGDAAMRDVTEEYGRVRPYGLGIKTGPFKYHADWVDRQMLCRDIVGSTKNAYLSIAQQEDPIVTGDKLSLAVHSIYNFVIHKPSEVNIAEPTSKQKVELLDAALEINDNYRAIHEEETAPQAVQNISMVIDALSGITPGSRDSLQPAKAVAQECIDQLTFYADNYPDSDIAEQAYTQMLKAYDYVAFDLDDASMLKEIQELVLETVEEINWPKLIVQMKPAYRKPLAPFDYQCLYSGLQGELINLLNSLPHNYPYPSEYDTATQQADRNQYFDLFHSSSTPGPDGYEPYLFWRAYSDTYAEVGPDSTA